MPDGDYMEILFIEDEAEISALGAEQMRNLGHQVYQAANLEEASQILNERSKRIGLIIADHRLPDGGGIDFVIDRVRKGSRIPAVVVSGFLTMADVAVLNQAGVPFFRKPVLYSEVLRRCRRVPPIHPVKETAAVEAEVDDLEEDTEAEEEASSPGFIRSLMSWF